MNTAFLLTGGNLGNRLQNLERAATLIEKYCGNIYKASSVYQTAAWGFRDQPDFYNQALELHTLFSPDELMAALLKIENETGRIRSFKMAPRIIDIDILFFNNGVIHEEHLTVPHPHLHERRFTLIPLCELMPEYIHPVFKKTLKQLLAECKDSKQVKLI